MGARGGGGKGTPTGGLGGSGIPRRMGSGGAAK